MALFKNTDLYKLNLLASYLFERREGEADVYLVPNDQIIELKAFSLRIKQMDFVSDWNWIYRIILKMKTQGYSLTTDPWEIKVIEYLTGNENEIMSFQIDSEDSLINNYFLMCCDFVELYNNIKQF